jgi:hypothetical protein
LLSKARAPDGPIGPSFQRIAHMTGVIGADFIEPMITPAEQQPRTTRRDQEQRSPRK